MLGCIDTQDEIQKCLNCKRPRCVNCLNKQPKGRIKPIYQIDKKTGEILNIYHSIRAASDATRINTKAISRCLRGISPGGGGYKWEYVQDIVDS